MGVPATVMRPPAKDCATEVTVPAPIAVLNVAASSAETVLSALILGKVIADGLVSVKKLEPTVLAPSDVLAPDAVVAAVPPDAKGSAEPRFNEEK